MSFIEQPIPAKPADDAEGVVISYDSQEASTGPFPNDLYAYVYHKSKTGGARCRYLPGPATARSKALDMLVLLDKPVIGVCNRTGESIVFQAAILREYSIPRPDLASNQVVTVEGWLINQHANAMATWLEQHPESIS